MHYWGVERPLEGGGDVIFKKSDNSSLFNNFWLNIIDNKFFNLIAQIVEMKSV